MYSYFYDTVVSLDIALFAISILTAAVTMFYLIFRQRRKEKYNSRLIQIKKNIHALATVGKRPSSETCPIVSVRSADELIDVETNRESVLFNDEEKECVKTGLTGSDMVSQIERTASSSRDKWRRIEALLALGYLGKEESIPILEKAMHEPDDDIRYFSILALAHIKTSASVSVLMRALHRKITSGYKIASIIEKFPPETADVLMPLAEKGDPSVRFWAIKILSRYVPHAFADRIAALMDDKSPDIRAAVCECLGNIGEAKHAELIKEILKDSVWYVRMHAVRALEKMLGSESVPLVVVLMRTDTHWQVKRAVGECLTKHIDRTIPFLVEILSGADKRAQGESVEIIEGSGYLKKILDGLLDTSRPRSDGDLRLLELIIKAGAYHGLESVIARYAEGDQRTALAAIALIDPERAEQVRLKIKGEIVDL